MERGLGRQRTRGAGRGRDPERVKGLSEQAGEPSASRTLGDGAGRQRRGSRAGGKKWEPGREKPGGKWREGACRARCTAAARRWEGAWANGGGPTAEGLGDGV